MSSQVATLVREAADEGVEQVAGKALLVAAPAVLAAAAMLFLVVAGYSALAEASGPEAAALVFAAGFAMLALAVQLVGRARSGRRRRRAAESRARMVGELSALRSLAGLGGAAAPLAALVAAFALARRA